MNSRTEGQSFCSVIMSRACAYEEEVLPKLFLEKEEIKRLADCDIVVSSMAYDGKGNENRCKIL